MLNFNISSGSNPHAGSENLSPWQLYSIIGFFTLYDMPAQIFHGTFVYHHPTKNIEYGQLMDADRKTSDIIGKLFYNQLSFFKSYRGDFDSSSTIFYDLKKTNTGLWMGTYTLPDKFTGEAQCEIDLRSENVRGYNFGKPRRNSGFLSDLQEKLDHLILHS